MRVRHIAISVFLLLLAFPVSSQSIKTIDLPMPANQTESDQPSLNAEKNPFVGKWTYRSFHNNPDISIPYNDLRFGAGTLEIVEAKLNKLSGTVGGTGWSLALTGWAAYGTPPTIRFQGKGIINEEEWVYDYVGYLVPNWPNGEGQRSAIIGTIVRTVSHGNGQSKAGYVASWIAVKQD